MAVVVVAVVAVVVVVVVIAVVVVAIAVVVVVVVVAAVDAFFYSPFTASIQFSIIHSVSMCELSLSEFSFFFCFSFPPYEKDKKNSIMKMES